MAFMQSNPMIYNQMKMGHNGLLSYLNNRDWMTILAPISNESGWGWDPNDDRLKQMGPMAMGANTPWIHAMSHPSKHCTFDHHLIFNNWQIIPPRCMECWKVCVAPNSFHQLLQLEAMQKGMDVPCKCGIELRDYTPRFYGGYFYTNSLDEGRVRYDQVKQMMADMIDDGNEIPIVLKRACTEYEFVKGPSPYWYNTNEELDFIAEVEARVEIHRPLTGQSSLVKNVVKQSWFLWAHMNGDFSYVQYNDGEKLFPDYVNYNEVDDLNMYKHDLAIANAVARGKIKAEDAEEYLVFTQEWMEKKGYGDKSLDTMATALGVSCGRIPLNLHKFPPVVVGGDDVPLENPVEEKPKAKSKAKAKK
jgi:hypothetical protein